MKKLSSLVLVLSFIFIFIFNSFAATATYEYKYNADGTARTVNVKGFEMIDVKRATPVKVSLKDFKRLTEVMSTVLGKEASIVNATPVDNTQAVWAIRVNYADDENPEAEDFIVTLCALERKDDESHEIISLPFKNVEEGCKIYGPRWFYCSLFDDNTHQICGFAIAERIKRWPLWTDMSYSGVTYSGKTYTGSYKYPSTANFVSRVNELGNPKEGEYSSSSNNWNFVK